MMEKVGLKTLNIFIKDGNNNRSYKIHVNYVFVVHYQCLVWEGKQILDRGYSSWENTVLNYCFQGQELAFNVNS